LADKRPPRHASSSPAVTWGLARRVERRLVDAIREGAGGGDGTKKGRRLTPAPL